MKTFRLKPLYLKANEILIKPPVTSSETPDFSLPPNSTMTLSSIDNLTSILRGRSLKAAKSRQGFEEEKESVEKLSEFRGRLRRFTRSPLSKRFTFKRTLSNLNLENPNNNTNPTPSPSKKQEEAPSIENLLRNISSRENVKNKFVESEFLKYQETNKRFEAGLINQRKAHEAQVQVLNREMTELKREQETIEKTRDKLLIEYQEKMSELAFQNTEGLLSLYKVNGRRRTNLEFKEEQEYLVLKQRLRKAQNDIHSSFIENKERLSERLESNKATVDSLQVNKSKLLKEVKEAQETLHAFYCRTLKDGMDLRDDGLRWCIKAIWKTSNPVPVSAFPKYLDEDSVTFLLRLAQIDLEVKSLQFELNDSRNKVSRDTHTSFEKSNEEIIRNVRFRLKMLSQTSKVVKAKLDISADLALEYTEKRLHVTDFCKIKEKIREKEGLKNRLSQVEIKRVVESYKIGESDVGILHIIRSLVGDKYRDFRTLTQKNSKSGKV